MSRTHDAIVVGAGIMGLALTYELLKHGHRVLVLERNARALGASYRAFGSIQPIAQRKGKMVAFALRSRAIWCDLIKRLHLWHRECGTILVAASAEERDVIQEFADDKADSELGCRLLSRRELGQFLPTIDTERHQLALYSPYDILVNPRQLLSLMSAWLEARGAEIRYGSRAIGCSGEEVTTLTARYSADRVFICTGDDLSDLFPTSDAPQELERVKLQMVAAELLPDSVRWDPILGGGLSMAHLPSFQACVSLKPLEERLQEVYCEHRRYGIHVMSAIGQNGTVLVGNSHEYGACISPIDNARIDELMMEYLRQVIPGLSVIQTHRWHAYYYRSTAGPFLVREVDASTTAVIGLGGSGLTLSMALAEALLAEQSVMSELDQP